MNVGQDPPPPLGRRCLWHYNQRQNLTLRLQIDLRALLHFIKGVIDWYIVLNTEHFWSSSVWLKFDSMFSLFYFFTLVQLYCTLPYQRYKWMLLWRWVKQFKGRVQLWKLQLLNKIMKSHLNWRVSLNWLLKKILVDNKFTLNNRIQQTKFWHYCVNKYRK